MFDICEDFGPVCPGLTSKRLHIKQHHSGSYVQYCLCLVSGSICQFFHRICLSNKKEQKSDILVHRSTTLHWSMWSDLWWTLTNYCKMLLLICFETVNQKMIQQWLLTSSYPATEEFLNLPVLNRASFQLLSVNSKLLSVLHVSVCLNGHSKRSELHWESHKQPYRLENRLTLMMMSWHLYFRATLSLISGSSMRFTYSCSTCRSWEAALKCRLAERQLSSFITTWKLMYLYRGAVLLQDVHHPVKANGRPFLGVPQPVLGVEQTIHIKPWFQLRSRAKSCENVLLFWNLPRQTWQNRLIKEGKETQNSHICLFIHY